MAFPPLAAVADMEKRLGVAVGSLAGLDRTRAEEALADASALVRLEAGKDWVAADGVTLETVPDAVRTVTRSAALRQFNNPDEFSSESVEGYAWQRPREAITVYLTDEEIATVRAAATTPPSRPFVGSIRTPSAYSSPYPAGTPYGDLPL